MKAFVIKNKEGKYKMSDNGVQLETYFHNALSSAEIFDDYEIALCDCPSNCKVIKITIAEGNLEQENKILKKALKLACECIKRYEQRDDTEIYELEYKIDYNVDAMARFYIKQAKENLK